VCAAGDAGRSAAVHIGGYNMLITDSDAVTVYARLKIRDLEFEVSPMSPEFYDAQSQEPDEDNSLLVHRVVNEIEKTVADLANVYKIQQLKYKFWPDKDRVVQDCTGTMIVPWKYKFLIQNRLIWRGYFYKQSEEISCLDRLLEPFEDKGQRYWADFDLDNCFTRVTDRQNNVIYDPRKLFDAGSSEHKSRLFKSRRENLMLIISDLGGAERAFALHFFRLRCAAREYSLKEAKSSFDLAIKLKGRNLSED